MISKVDHKSGPVWFLAVNNSVLKHCSDCAIELYSNGNLNDLEFDDGSTTKQDVIRETVGEVFLLIRAIKESKRDEFEQCLFSTVNQVIRLCDVINNATYLQQALDEVKRFENSWGYFAPSEIVTHLYYKGRHCFQKGGDDLERAKKVSIHWPTVSE